MPPIKLEKVVSVSSEDAVHSAANLLKGEFNNLKWKSKKCGEKQISVVFQLDKPSKITSIDVGNENSAFIEILVAKSSINGNFNVLLAASSLMSLREVKNSENTNGVKFYKTEDLIRETCNERWDRIKIVCTQPFNSIVQFGLSFIVFHTDEVVKTQAPDLGNFRLKQTPSSSSPVKISAWSLKPKGSEPRLKGAAAVRVDDIKLPTAKKFVTAKVSSFTPEVDTDSDNYSPSDEPESEDFYQSTGESPKKRAKTPSKKKQVKNDTVKRQTPKPKLDQSASKKRPIKPKVVAVSNFKSKPKKPFNRLLEGVFFVISGFQNPHRSDIRNSALAMGAKYKADWDDSCSHLVCAFRNTPKFNQVQGRGKIVTKDWIDTCYHSRKRLPWRRFALDPQDSSLAESEEEIFEEVAPGPSVIDNRRRSNSSSEEDDVEKEVKRIKRQQDHKPRINTQTKTDNKKPIASNSGNKVALSYEKSDDDKVELTGIPNVYDASTEEDSETERNARILYDLPVLPGFFDTWYFLILDDLDVDDRAQLKRYILARAGRIVTDMNELSAAEQGFCITQQKSRAEEIIESFPNVRAVLPDWIWLCHDENQLQDEKPYCL